MPLSRRHFLGTLTALPLGLLAPAGASARTRATLINVFTVAGLAYYDAREADHALRVEGELHLLPEPTNRHDPFAVEIEWRGHKLGYVPRSDNKHISRLLTDGAPLVCHVAAIDDNEGWSATNPTIKAKVKLVRPAAAGDRYGV